MNKHSTSPQTKSQNVLGQSTEMWIHFLHALQDTVQINPTDINMKKRLRRARKPCVRNVDFVILMHIFVNYKLCSPEIWHTSTYGYSVSG
jgi:hypothetical protein